jgi:hypothetical protein
MIYKRKITLILLAFLTVGLTYCSSDKKLSIEQIKKISKEIVTENLTNNSKDPDIEEISILYAGYLHDDKYINNIINYLNKTNNYRVVSEALVMMDTSNSIKTLEELFEKEKSIQNKLIIAQFLVLANKTNYLTYLEEVTYKNEKKEIDELLVQILDILVYEKLYENKRLLYSVEKIIELSTYIANKPIYKEDKIVVDCVKIWALAAHSNTTLALKYFLGDIKKYYDNIYGILNVADTYLKITNDREFILYMENLYKGMRQGWNSLDENYRLLVKILMAEFGVVLYHHTEDKELKRWIEKFFDNELEKSKLFLNTAAFLGSDKYVKKALYDGKYFQWALMAIRSEKLYETKKDLVKILKRGFPASWDRTINNKEENKRIVMERLINTVFDIIKAKSRNKKADIGELSFLLFYNDAKSSPEFNSFVRLVAAGNMLSVIEKIEK